MKDLSWDFLNFSAWRIEKDALNKIEVLGKGNEKNMNRFAMSSPNLLTF